MCMFLYHPIMAVVIAFFNFYYCLKWTSFLVLSSVCVYVFVLLRSFAQFYFIIGLWDVGKHQNK
jgi:hypothetical protein